jgi:Na+/melibiose symporter-like transporter
MKDDSIAFGIVSFSAAAMHNVFITYYVQLYMDVYHLSERWFYIGQVVYAVWNSVNDPLFGKWLERQQCALSSKRGRLLPYIDAIEYGGAIWALAFVWLFFPFSLIPGDNNDDDNSLYQWLTLIHFVLVVCLYDAMLSYVMLSHASMLADLAIASQLRAKYNTTSAMFGVAGSLSILFSHYFYSQSLFAFRCYALAIGALSVAIFIWSASHFRKRKLADNSQAAAVEKEKEEEEEEESKPKQLSVDWLRYLGGLKLHRNLLVFVAITWFQVLNCHFNSNFMSIFLDEFLPRSALWVKSVALALSGALPHALVVAYGSMLQRSRVTLYVLLRRLFLAKLALPLVALALLFVYRHWALLALAILALKVHNETICRHGNLVIADLVDEDAALFRRSHAIPTMIFGANALFTKSAQSVAPMLATFVIGGDGGRQALGDTDAAVPPTSNFLHSRSFAILIAVPIVVALVQLALWRTFTLHSHRLSQVKRFREHDEQV